MMSKLANLWIIPIIVFLLMLTPRPSYALSLLMGTVVHIHPNKVDPDTFFKLSKEVGINSIRINVSWWDVEEVKDTLSMNGPIPSVLERSIDTARARGIEPQLVLGYSSEFYDNGSFPISDQAQAAFVRYAEFVVRHFKGRVRYYEIWTEWNIGLGTKHGLPHRYSNSAKDYAKLLKKTYQAVKRIDPTATFIMSAAAYREAWWNDEVIRLADGQYDGIAVHPYNWSAGSDKNTPEEAIAWLDLLYRRFSTPIAPKPVPLFITEIGWPMHQGTGGISPATAAAYLARFYFLAALRPYLRGVWWYNYRDDGEDKTIVEQNFGLVTHTYQPKLGWYAFKQVTAILRGATSARTCDLGMNLQCVHFTQTNGESVLTIWQLNKSAPVKICLRPEKAGGEVVLAKIGIQKPPQTLHISKGGEFCETIEDDDVTLIRGNIAISEIHR